MHGQVTIPPIYRDVMLHHYASGPILSPILAFFFAPMTSKHKKKYTPLKCCRPTTNAMPRNVPEDWRPLLNCSENLKYDMDKFVHTSLIQTCITTSKHNSQSLASTQLESSLLFFRSELFLFFFFFV